MEDKRNIKVLVTGASGYVALHCVQHLLNSGYSVRGTVRSLKNARKVDPLKKMNSALERLELVEADLVENVGIWPEVVRGCQYILHVASPWPVVADESTIDIAVNGTLTVLKAATVCGGVKKIVLTSSCAAINDGHKNNERVFDETCWTNLEGKSMKKMVDNYAKSKTLAEKAAWKYWNSLDESNKFDLTVLNPTFVTGPVLSDVEHGSASIIGRMVNISTFLATPKVCLGVVDVRDVARAHVAAIEDPTRITNGQRILLSHNQPVWFSEIIKWISKEFKSQGFFPTPFVVPNWMVKIYAKTNIDPMSSAVLYRLGPELRFNNKKSVDMLKITYIDPQDSVVDMVYSLIKFDMLPKSNLPISFSKLKKQFCKTSNNKSNVQTVLKTQT